MEPEHREDQHALDKRDTEQSPSRSTQTVPHLSFASEGLEQVRGGHC
jgi:hypothetical protein